MYGQLKADNNETGIQLMVASAQFRGDESAATRKKRKREDGWCS
jgi:hypothetical protein